MNREKSRQVQADICRAVESLLDAVTPQWPEVIVEWGRQIRDEERRTKERCPQFVETIFPDQPSFERCLIWCADLSGLSKRKAALILRVVLTGQKSGLPLHSIVQILGVDETGNRIVHAATHCCGDFWERKNDA